MLLALVLGLGKRRNNLMTLAGRAARDRANLETYTPRLLDQLISLSAASGVRLRRVHLRCSHHPGQGERALSLPLPRLRSARVGSPEVLLMRHLPLFVAIFI